MLEDSWELYGCPRFSRGLMGVSHMDALVDSWKGNQCSTHDALEDSWEENPCQRRK